jgi:hypothetical protein
MLTNLPLRVAENGLVLIPGIDELTTEFYGGIPDPQRVSAVQEFPLGTMVIDPAFGRIFRYARAGAVALDRGKLMQTVVPIADHANCAVAGNVAIGGKTVVVTLNGATVATANQYAGGFLIASDATGEGHTYRIKSNTAAGAGGTPTIVLYDQIKVALVDATSELTLIQCPYNGLIVHPSPPTARPAGVPIVDVPIANYFWLQTRGPVGLLQGGVWVITKALVPDTAVDGAAIALALAEAQPNTDADQTIIGYAMNNRDDTEYGVAYLTLD